MDSELIPHQTVTAIVENVALAKDEVRQAFDLLISAKARLHGTLGRDTYYDTLFPSGGRFSDYDLTEKGVAEIHRRIRQNSWRYILAQTGLNHFMTEKRQKELREQIERDELPPLTVDNIFVTIDGLAGRVDGLLNESVKEVFDWLRPRSDWGVGALKTNKKFRVGERAIVSGVERNYTGGFRISHWHDGQFRALGNVFSLLDGKGVIKYPDDFLTRFNEAMKDASAGDKFEDDYFEMKCYGNRNMHIKFKRLDLLAKLNRVGGGDGLPGQERAA